MKRALVVAFSLAITINEALALSWIIPDKPGHPGPSGPTAAPELDGSGAIAVFALIASVALVLFNRSRNR